MRQHPAAAAAVAAFTVYGLRYLVLATLAFAVARPTPGFGLGRLHVRAPQRLALGPQVRREVGWSLMTLWVFGAVYAALFGWGLLRHSQIYLRLDAWPVAWFWASIVVALLLHDTLFYWLHRLMHHPALFGWMHRQHHRSVHPTGFAAYRFHPAEALAEALLVVVIVFVLPMHPLALLLFQTVSTAYNVYGHCGREFYPRGTADHWAGRWLNTSTAHAVHHGTGRHHYGLYFLFWDRWMGTLAKPAP